MRVLVTGASRGIGRALVDALVARGDQVIATVRRAEDLAGVGFEVLTMDVADTASVRAARATLAGPLDLLVSNAGISGGPQRAPGMDLLRAASVIDVNALGALRVYDAFVDLLRASPRTPWLVHVSSEAGSLGRFRASSKPEYAMSKAAMNALTRWIAAVEDKVRVVSMHPGWTRTDLGGPNAPRTAEETAAAMLVAIDRLEPAHHGGFVDTELATIPW